MILVPTIAIRNQWVQRFCELFLQVNEVPEWISRDIRNPKFMTVSTYQGLHAACNNFSNEEDVIAEDGVFGNSNIQLILERLKAQNIKTIVVDEAHHLKNEWWQTLIQVKTILDPVLVGLTVTPPYDVSGIEWERYNELNGPVDKEISVPELVIEGDLCPHQDYVYFTMPTEVENQKIIEFRYHIEVLFNEIRQDQTIVQAIEQHPIWKNPLKELDWIYTNLEYYSACLIFLRSFGKEIPETHLEVIGEKTTRIPELDYEWGQTLLEFYLYKEKKYFKGFEDHRRLLENRLRRHGVIERKQINFIYNSTVASTLTSSISKIGAIQNIVDFEYRYLGDNLRLVVLSDYIRKEFFVDAPINDLEVNKIGVIPVFENLRRNNKEGKKIGVLTGSIVIIPKSAYHAFERKAAEYGIKDIEASLVPFDSNYMVIHQSVQLKHSIVHIITQIFQQGDIQVLIGTKALLGEGWDAPAINTLILASFVGSFVLSNQMRGRAIRTQKGNGHKTGNIWHLCCVDPMEPTGGNDFELLKRRFKSFVGLTFDEDPGIENGMGRLNIPEIIDNQEVVDNINLKMQTLSSDRERLKEYWDMAIEHGVNLVEEIKIPFHDERGYNEVKSLYLNKTIKNLMATLGSGVAWFGFDALHGLARSARNIRTIQDLYYFLAIFGIIGVAIFGRLTLKTFRLYFMYRDISKDIQKISGALLNSLIENYLIQTKRSELNIKISVDKWGAVYCHLEGGSTFEKSTFISALQEIISPIENPRYIIVRKNRFMFFIKQKDYHSVPEILGRRKKLAESFKKQWEETVGSCELIFTRTIEGRKLLLKSKVGSLAAQFNDKIEHINKWR